LPIAVLFFGGDARACGDFAAAPSSRWSIAGSAAGPVLLTPCGEPFFSLGVNGVDGGLSTGSAEARGYRWERFAASRSEWAAAARRRLLEWGFNTAGAWSLAPSELALPSTPELELGRTVNFVWTDPFDPALPAKLQRAAAQAVAPFRGNPLRIGYFSDNEIGWWNGPLFMGYLAYSPHNHTKQRLIQLLRAHYGNRWEAFASDFIPAPGTASFADLLTSQEPPRLRPGGAGIRVVRAWTHVVTGRYYSLMRQALHSADPDALFLGDRLPIYYDPDAVRAMAPYVDAISVNYNVDAADGWVAPYFFNALRELSGGKPVLITEWFYAATENRSGNLNRTGWPRRTEEGTISNNRNLTGHLMTVATQAERARGAGRAALLLAAVPNAIGVHWFQYADEPPGGRTDGEDYNFGLVDINDHPYQELIRALQAGNRGARSRVGPSPAPPDAEGEIVLPRAAIDPVSESLAEWPKAASLVPMTPAPAEAVFGDLHLAWNERGLFLATIAMDYYDPELLGNIAPFPRSEAFRIALGVDAGGGPRRIELRVIPSGLEQLSRREERLSFAVQTCWYAAGDGCTPVAGAIARYFGTALDQPRVILKGFIPWSQLGVAGPPERAALRLALGVTAFYRSKWMSSDGAMPDVAIAHPETWRAARLKGDAALDWVSSTSANRAAAPPN
jgi:hypothetical protein